MCPLSPQFTSVSHCGRHRTEKIQVIATSSYHAMSVSLNTASRRRAIDFIMRPAHSRTHYALRSSVCLSDRPMPACNARTDSHRKLESVIRLLHMGCSIKSNHLVFLVFRYRLHGQSPDCEVQSPSSVQKQAGTFRL